MTHPERPRRKDYSAEEWPAVRDAWAAHLSPRRPVRERITERVIERMGQTVQPVEMDEATRQRIADLEASLAQSDAALRFLLEPVEDIQPPADIHNFPENMSDKLSDWDTVPDEASQTAPIPEDIAQFMSPDETLADAVERLTPGLDELLGMAEGLSDTSLEMAIAAIPLKRANDWTTRIYDERAVLRTKRGTDGENLGRENLLRRVESVFSRAGSKI